MVPINFIESWQRYASWLTDSQVEQDLILSRALVELFNNDIIRNSVALRGGTALNKLFSRSLTRYSEDIDLVMIKKEKIGHILWAIRNTLEPWLGKPKWNAGPFLSKLTFRFQSEENIQMKLKIEINIIETFNVYGYQYLQYDIQNKWFSGSAQIRTYQLEELIGTKLRALYQRIKGRDLFDIWLAITKLNLNIDQALEAFHYYNKVNNISISRAEYEKNLMLKIQANEFLEDIRALLSEEVEWNAQDAYSTVMDQLISKLPGEPYKNLIK